MNAMHTRDVLPPGTLLDGKYRIDRLIGSGGFGMTYMAHDLGLNQPVAVKEYYPAQFGMREGTLTVRPATEKDQDLFDRLKESFLREARTLAQFRHPAIVRVVSVFEGHGTAYMIMEYEAGRSLKGWLEGLGRVPTQAELDRIVMPILDALEVMHAASFLHRDIAPDNIIVRADGSPVLLDFGAARRVMAELSGALTGIVKQGYSPQEQYANDPRAQGPWSDIYALGATLYRSVTGVTPAEATLRMLDDPLKPASELAAGAFRPGFLAAIDRSLALRPKDRPQTVAELRRLLSASDGDSPSAASDTRQALPGGGGWSRISPPPKAHISGRYAANGRGWRLGIGAIAVAAIGILLMAMLGYAGRRTDEVRRQEEIQRQAEPSRAEQRTAEAEKLRREVEQRLLAERDRLKGEADRQRAAEEARRLAEAQKAAETAGRQKAAEPTVAARLEEQLGACPFCDDVRKLATPADFAELVRLPATIEATWREVKDRAGANEDAAARRLLEQIVKADLSPDPVASVKTGQQTCTLYNFGFLGNAAERVGTHKCMVRMVQIGGNIASLTLEKLSGDGYFADLKPYRVNGMAALARTYLKGHAVTRYNLAVPKARENGNYGNAIGLLVSLGGKTALISANQNGFTEPDATFFSVLLLE